MAALHQDLLPDLPPHWRPLCISRLHFHVTWLTRDRRPVLVEDRVESLRHILEGLADELGVNLETVAITPDRVHLLLSLKPSDSAGSVVRELKGRSALDLMARRPDVRVSLGGNLLWSETYGISTVSPGNLDKRKSRLEKLDVESQAILIDDPDSCSRF